MKTGVTYSISGYLHDFSAAPRGRELEYSLTIKKAGTPWVQSITNIGADFVTEKDSTRYSMHCSEGVEACGVTTGMDLDLGPGDEVTFTIANFSKDFDPGTGEDLETSIQVKESGVHFGVWADWTRTYSNLAVRWGEDGKPENFSAIEGETEYSLTREVKDYSYLGKRGDWNYVYGGLSSSFTHQGASKYTMMMTERNVPFTINDGTGTVTLKGDATYSVGGFGQDFRMVSTLEYSKQIKTYGTTNAFGHGDWTYRFTKLNSDFEAAVSTGYSVSVEEARASHFGISAAWTKSITDLTADFLAQGATDYSRSYSKGIYTYSIGDYEDATFSTPADELKLSVSKELSVDETAVLTSGLPAGTASGRKATGIFGVDNAPDAFRDFTSHVNSYSMQLDISDANDGSVLRTASFVVGAGGVPTDILISAGVITKLPGDVTENRTYSGLDFQTMESVYHQWDENGAAGTDYPGKSTVTIGYEVETYNVETHTGPTQISWARQIELDRTTDRNVSYRDSSRTTILSISDTYYGTASLAGRGRAERMSIVWDDESFGDRTYAQITSSGMAVDLITVTNYTGAVMTSVDTYNASGMTWVPETSGAALQAMWNGALNFVGTHPNNLTRRDHYQGGRFQEVKDYTEAFEYANGVRITESRTDYFYRNPAGGDPVRAAAVQNRTWKADHIKTFDPRSNTLVSETYLLDDGLTKNYSVSYAPDGITVKNLSKYFYSKASPRDKDLAAVVTYEVTGNLAVVTSVQLTNVFTAAEGVTDAGITAEGLAAYGITAGSMTEAREVMAMAANAKPAEFAAAKDAVGTLPYGQTFTIASASILYAMGSAADLAAGTVQGYVSSLEINHNVANKARLAHTDVYALDGGLRLDRRVLP